MPAHAGEDHHSIHHSPIAEDSATDTKRQQSKLLAEGDVFAENQKAQQDELDALLDNLAPPTDLHALQSFLVSDAAQIDKIQQLVSFLADGPMQESHDELIADGPAPESHNELMAATDVFAQEQSQKQKELERLVDSLTSTTTAKPARATALMATDADDVDVSNAQASFLNVIGGAVLLLVAVVLAVVTKRSRSKREAEDEDKDFGYSILYE